MATFDFAGTLDVLAEQELFLGCFLAGAGLVYMILGWRIYRSLVALSFGVLGFVLGWHLGGTDPGRLMLGLAMAGVLGTATTVFCKPAATVLAATWAGYGILLLAGKFELPSEAQLALVGLAFVGAISMSLIMHREVTALVLSLEGSLLFLGGLVIFLNQSPVLWGNLRNILVGNPIFAPFAVLTGTVTGFYWQTAELRQREAGTTS